MDITYRIKSVNGDTSFQHVTLKVTSSAEGDYFDMKGNYLGSTSQSKKNIYIVGRDILKNPYSMATLPKDFFDKQVSFDGIGNIVNLNAGAKYGTIITDLSDATRYNVAENIYNHYYTEAGFDLNRLKYKTITDASEDDTGFAITKFGGISPNSENLKKNEASISIVYQHLGKNLDTGYDIMSLCSHEHKHLDEFIMYGKKMEDRYPETIAYTYQTLEDKNWKHVSLGFKSAIRPIAKRVMYQEDYNKAFGDKKQYENVVWKPGKKITL